MPVPQSQFTDDDDDERLAGHELMPLQRVGVAVLGARGVGKTSLVSQFVYHDLQPPDVDRTARYKQGHLDTTSNLDVLGISVDGCFISYISQRSD